MGGFFYIVVFRYIFENSYGIIVPSEVYLLSVEIDGVFYISLVGGPITVSDKDLGPVVELRVFHWVIVENPKIIEWLRPGFGTSLIFYEKLKKHTPKNPYILLRQSMRTDL